MTRQKKYGWFGVVSLIIAVILAVMVVDEAAHASGDRITQSNDMNTATTGNVSTGGNQTFAFSHGLGDVDINEGKNCMGSTQWGTIIISKQDLALNPWCAALFYELNGKHQFAAKMRCDIKEVRRKYQTNEECWTDQDLTPPESAPTVLQEHHELESQHDEDIVVVQQQLAQVLEELEQVKAKPAPRATGESDFARRAARARAILKEGDEE